MVESVDLEELRKALGRHLAGLRADAGYTQEALAPEIHYTRSTIANAEVGRQQVSRAFWTRCDDVVHAHGQLIEAYDRIEQLRTSLRRRHTRETSASMELSPSLPAAARAAVLAVHVGAVGHDISGVVPARAAVARAHGAYQRADYDLAASMVPTLMGAAFFVAAGDRPDDQRNMHATVAAAHLAVSKLALKFGDAQVAWVAADRAHGRAIEADSIALLRVALVAIGSALLALPGREQDAADLVERGLSGTAQDRLQSPAEISGLGAMTLLAAVIAARFDNRPQVRANLRAARALADELGGDRNELWTGFGPTNVLIHEVGITARDEPDRAIAAGQRLDIACLHPALVSRRSQLHLDLAFAFAQTAGGDPSAVLHLLQAERLAPQLLRIHPPARSLILSLLGRERQAATPGLRDLAARAGLAV